MSKRAQLNAPLPAGIDVRNIRRWLNDIEARQRKADNTLKSIGKHSAGGGKSNGTPSAFAVLTGLRDANDYVLADIFRGSATEGGYVLLEEDAAIIVLNRPPDGSDLWDATEGAIMAVLKNGDHWEGLLDEAPQEAVTAKRIKVHWLGHTFNVSASISPSDLEPLVWLEVQTHSDGDQGGRIWNKSMLEGASAIWRGDEWPDENGKLVFPLMELDGGNIIYHRNYRVIDDDGTPRTIFDAVTIKDDPIGTVKIIRGGAGMPVGWTNATQIDGEFDNLYNRIFTPADGSLIDHDTSDYLKLALGTDTYRIRRMLYIQRVAVVDTP